MLFDLKRQRAGEQGSHKNAALLPTDYTLRRLGGSGDIAWLLLLPDVSFQQRGGGGDGAGGCVRLRDLRGPSRQFSHCYRVDRRRRRDRNETNIPGHYHPSPAAQSVRTNPPRFGFNAGAAKLDQLLLLRWLLTNRGTYDTVGLSCVL